VELETPRFVADTNGLDWIGGHCRRQRDFGQGLAVRAAELKLAVGPSIDRVTLLVDGPVMPTAQQRKVGQRRGAAVGPVPDVMALAEADPAAREATTTVPVMQRPP
jgi:hypothetical protein